MKKIIMIFTLFTICEIQTFGHAYTITRNWCGGIVHRKFVAYARISAWSSITYSTGYNCLGQLVGTNPYVNWTTICQNDDKGCTRPRIADCNRSGVLQNQIYSGCYLQLSGFNSYSGHARAEHLTSGINITQTAGPNASAGITGAYLVDTKKFDQLSRNGFGNSKVTGSVEINKNNELIIHDLSGLFSIKPKTDYFSKLLIVVIKERDDISELEAKTLEKQYQSGIFENVVYSSELTVTNNKIAKTGFWEDLESGKLILVEGRDSYGVKLNNINFSKKINTKLKKNEHLTVVTMVDGGLDFSSTIIKNIKLEDSPSIDFSNDSSKLFNLPENGIISLKVYSDAQNKPISITEVDENNKAIRIIYEGKLKEGDNSIEKLDFSNPRKTPIIIKFKIGNDISISKFSKK